MFAASIRLFLSYVNAPLLPLLVGGASRGVVLSWLAGLGGNALAGWLASWSEREVRKLLSEDTADEHELLEQLAVHLQTQLAGDKVLQEELATLLDRTDGISTAIDSLALQADAQTRLIDALRVDIRQSNLIQGHLHQLIVHQLGEAEARTQKSLQRALL